jgi:hypothetical protein
MLARLVKFALSLSASGRLQAGRLVATVLKIFVTRLRGFRVFV